MNLKKKKALAKKALKVGGKRIAFVESRIDEIKEAITKQDIRELQKEGAIIVKEIKGKTKKETKSSRSTGNIRKKIRKRKRTYGILAKKLRKYIFEMKNQGKISPEESLGIRKKIRNKDFRDFAHLKEYLKETVKENKE